MDASAQLLEALSRKRLRKPEIAALSQYLSSSRHIARHAFSGSPKAVRHVRLVSKILKFYKQYSIASVDIHPEGATIEFEGIPPYGEHTLELSEFAIKTMLDEPYEITDL